MIIKLPFAINHLFRSPPFAPRRHPHQPTNQPPTKYSRVGHSIPSHTKQQKQQPQKTHPNTASILGSKQEAGGGAGDGVTSPCCRRSIHTTARTRTESVWRRLARGEGLLLKKNPLRSDATTRTSKRSEMLDGGGAHWCYPPQRQNRRTNDILDALSLRQTANALRELRESHDRSKTHTKKSLLSEVTNDPPCGCHRTASPCQSPTHTHTHTDTGGVSGV